MTGRGDGITVQFVRIDRIRILNPRERDKKKFLEIVDSIRKVGLKQPINRTVRPRTVSLKAVLCQIDPDHANPFHGCPFPLLALTTPPTWHIAMPPEGGVHSINTRPHRARRGAAWVTGTMQTRVRRRRPLTGLPQR